MSHLPSVGRTRGLYVREGERELACNDLIGEVPGVAQAVCRRNLQSECKAEREDSRKLIGGNSSTNNNTLKATTEEERTKYARCAGSSRKLRGAAKRRANMG